MEKIVIRQTQSLNRLSLDKQYGLRIRINKAGMMTDRRILKLRMRKNPEWGEDKATLMDWG